MSEEYSVGYNEGYQTGRNEAIDELEQENSLLRARNDRLEAEAKMVSVQEPVACHICGGQGFIKCDALQSREKNNGKWGRCLNCQPYTTPPAAPVLEGRDWSLLEATQESLREHMVEIKRLKEAQPAVPDAIHQTDLSEHPQYIEGWNDCRAEMLKGMKP